MMPEKSTHKFTSSAAGPDGSAAVLRSLLNAAYRIESSVAVLALVTMTAIVFADVLGREVFDQGIAGAQRIGVYAFVFAGFLGLPLATAQGTHLRPKFADPLIPPPLEGIAVRVQHLLAALLSVGLAWFGLNFARETLALNEVSPILEIPVGLVQLALPYAFASSGLRHLLYAMAPSLAPIETGDTS